jgi:hypothetical protein
MELIKNILHEYKCGIAITKFNIEIKLNKKFDDELEVFINTFNNMNQKYSYLMGISKEENQNLLRSDIEELKIKFNQFLKFSETVNQEATEINLLNKPSTNDNDDYILLFKNILLKIHELKNYIKPYFTNQFNEKPSNTINKELNEFIERFKLILKHFAGHLNTLENDYYTLFYQQLLILSINDNNINSSNNNNNNNNNDNNNDNNDKIMVVNHPRLQENLSLPPLDEFSLILEWEKLLFFYNDVKSVIKERRECLSSLLIIPRSIYQKNPALRVCHSNIMGDDAKNDCDNALLKDDNDHYLVNEEEKTDYLNPICISEDISESNLLSFTVIIANQYDLFKKNIEQKITQHQWYNNQHVPFLNEKLIEFKRFKIVGSEFYNFDKVTDVTQLLLPTNDLDDLSQHTLFTKKYHNNLLKCINQQENNQGHAHLHSSEQIKFIKLVAKYNQLVLFHIYLERIIVDDETKNKEYYLSLEPKMPPLQKPVKSTLGNPEPLNYHLLGSNCSWYYRRGVSSAQIPDVQTFYNRKPIMSPLCFARINKNQNQ